MNNIASAVQTAKVAAPEKQADPFAELFALGYRSLLPIVPPGVPISDKSTIAKRLAAGKDDRGKTPGIRGDDGFWRGMNWRTAVATPETMAFWRAMGAGVGIRTGDIGDGTSLLAIDIDSRDKEISSAAFACAERHFGRLFPRFGDRPKALCLVRCEGGYAYSNVLFGDKTPRERVEILSDGKQFVAKGIHARTLKPYEWPRGVPALQDLPLVTPQQMDAFLAELRTILPACSEVNREGGEGGPEIDQATLKGDLALVRRAVEAMRNTSTFIESREDWLKVGYAIKAATQDDPDLGYDLFMALSERWEDPPADWHFEPDYVEAEWRRMKPPYRVGAPYLYELSERASGGKFSRAEQWFETRPAYEPLFPEEPAEPRQKFDFGASARLNADDLSNFPPRDLVLGTRFQRKTLTIRSGPPGVSKSTFEVLGGLAIASGRPLTGEHVVKPGPVLIYNAEDPKEESWRRLAACAHTHGVDLDLVCERVFMLSGDDDRRIVFAERRDRNGPIVPGPDVEDLAAFVRAEGIVYVSFDPMIALHRGLDENSSSDMEALGNELRRFAKLSCAAVGLIRH